MPPKATDPGVSGAYTPSELAGLTVQKLKALCKERKIPGYSKLGKQVLIEKLGAVGSSTSGCPPKSSAPVTSRAWANPPPVAQAPPGPLFLPNGPSSSIAPEGQVSKYVQNKRTRPSKPAPRLPTIDTSTSKITSHPSLAGDTRPGLRENPLMENGGSALAISAAIDLGDTQGASATVSSPASDSLSGLPTRIPQLRSLASPSLNAPLPVRHACDDTIAVGSSSQPPSSFGKRMQSNAECMRPPPSKRSRLLPPAPVPVANPSQTTASPVRGLASSKRFKPLVVDRSKLQGSPIRPPSQFQVALDTPAAADRSVTRSPDTSLGGLELDCFTTVPELFPITMPPTLSQRKRVHRWAVILSGLSNAERAVCVLVSRAFRYAVYLSASTILTTDYAGCRLQEDVLCKYSQAMTNMWPYLRLREAEVARRRHLYETSFIFRFFQKLGLPNPIASRVWASPDNPKQLSVAVRFALTRAWFEFSVGSPRDSRANPDSWLRGAIVDVQEVVAAEIWSVTVEYPATLIRPRRRETFYVLEATCEVIGRPVGGMSDSGVSGYPLRVDWSTYIADRMMTRSSTEEPLLSHLKWACQEDYDRGISVLWLKKMASVEGQTGAAKRTVAERYVMASVMGNSVSGQWMTTNEMAQEFAGLPARTAAAPLGRQKNATLNLFLPEHHHVESVHFTATGGKDLHPVLAVVQTPHREYYILRDNGMQVGCEEDGVAEVWQEVLRCDTRGLPLSL